jgi:hypothetical protein
MYSFSLRLNYFVVRTSVVFECNFFIYFSINRDIHTFLNIAFAGTLGFSSSLSLSYCSRKTPCTATKIPLMYSFSGNSAASAQFPLSCVHERFIYSSRIGLHISSNRIGRPIVGIYKSLTDAWMWKLGLRPRYFFSGNICFEISVFCLCVWNAGFWTQGLPYSRPAHYQLSYAAPYNSYASPWPKIVQDNKLN